MATLNAGAPHRILCFAEPLAIRFGPHAFELAVRQFARLLERLALIPRIETAILCNDALAVPTRGVRYYTPGAHGLPSELLPDWRERWVAQLHGAARPDWTAFYHAVLEHFDPSCVYVYNTNPAFEACCRERGVPLLYVELGGIRTTTGARMSVDPGGFGAASALATARCPGDSDPRAEWGWRWAAEHVLVEAQNLRSQAFRTRRSSGPHVVVPLQYEDDVNWVLNPTFSDTLDFVDQVVPSLLAGGAAQVSLRLHPWHRHIGVLSRIGRWSNVTVDFAWQNLLGSLADVDAVVTLNSTVGLEALACGVPACTLSPGAYPCAYRPAGLSGLADFLDEVVSARYWSTARRLAVGSHLYRLVAHYSLPEELYESSQVHLDLLDAWSAAGSSPDWFAAEPAHVLALAEANRGEVALRRISALRQDVASVRAAVQASAGRQARGEDPAIAAMATLARWRSGAYVNEEELLALARALPNSEPPTTAALLYGEVLQRSPSPRLRYNLASALQQCGHADTATALFSELASAGDDTYRPGALFHLGMLARTQHRSAQAYSAFQGCLELSPAHHAAMDGLQATLRDTAVDGWSRVDGCEWRELDTTSLSASLYGAGGSGAKRYEVRFGNGRVLPVVQTRERSFADVRGATELSRYRLLTPFLQAGWQVLDCASGTGYGSAWLASQGLRVTGAEVDSTAVTFARHRYPAARFVRVSAPHLPFATASFDAVTCVETLEHFTEHEAFIDEVARVLRPGGLLLLTTPPAGRHDSPFHVRERSWPEIVALLARWFGTPDSWVRPHRTSEGFGHEIVARRIGTR